MNEFYGPDWATILTLREADQGRRVGSRRLREAETRRAELLGAEELPRLQDAAADPVTDIVPQVPTGSVPLETTPDTGSESPGADTKPLTPRVKAPPTEAPSRPRLTVAAGSPGVYASGQIVALGGKALKPHDASQESYEAYAAKLEKSQEQLTTFGIPLPERVYAGFLAKARLEEETYRIHAHKEPEERRRAQIISLQQDLVMEELNRSGSDPTQELRVEALYGILRDKDVDVDKLRERLVSGNRIDSPVFLTNSRPVNEQYNIGESTPLSGSDAPFRPVPRFPTGELESSVTQLREEVRTLQLDLTQERLRSTEIAKQQAANSGVQTPIPPQLIEIIDKQMETNATMMREHRQESRMQMDAMKDFIAAAKAAPALAAKKKSSVLQVKPEIKWPKLGDDGPGGKEIEIFYERF